MEKKIPASDARADLSTLVNEVAFGKSRTILTRRGKDIAAIVPIEDIELLRRIENEIDGQKIAARQHEPTLPFDTVLARIGLKVTKERRTQPPAKAFEKAPKTMPQKPR